MSDKRERLHVVTLFVFLDSNFSGSIQDAIEAGTDAMVSIGPGIGLSQTASFLLREGPPSDTRKAWKTAFPRITDGLFHLAAETQAMRVDESPNASDEPETPS